MDAFSFCRRYETTWKELESLISRKREFFRNASCIAELSRLYREITSHLSYARTYFPHDDVTLYLNGLVGRAHLVVYGKQGGQWRSVLEFLIKDFPESVRSVGWFFFLAWFVMLAGAAVGFFTVLASPNSIYALLPNSLIAGFDPLRTGPHYVDAPQTSSLIMTHNIEVTVLSFLGAFTLGIFTLYELYFNGLLLGAIAAVFLHAHRSLIFWSLILPHGGIELTAISIAGAAGLMVAYRLLVPLRLTRARSLQFAGVKGAKMMAGTVGMLVLAGTIEGFITPSFLPLWFKYGFALATIVALIGYFGFAGRGKRQVTT